MARTVVDFPLPGLPHQREDLARAHVEADAVDGADRADAPAQQPGPGQREVVVEVGHPQHLGAVLAGGRRSAGCGRCGARAAVRAGAAGGAPAGQQRDRLRGARAGEDLLDVAVLDHPPGVHDGDPVREAGHHPQVVADEHERGAGLLPRGAQHVEDLRLDGDVEGGGRLVGDEHVRVVGDGQGDRHPLAHAAGELVGVGAEPRGRPVQADELEQLDRPGPGRGTADPAVGLERLDEQLAHRVHRGQRRLGVLLDQPDAGAAHPGQLGVAAAEELLPAQPHRARDPGRRGQQPHDGQGGDGLARAGRPDDGEHLPRRDRQVHAPHGVHDAVGRAQPHVQPGDLQGGAGRSCAPAVGGVERVAQAVPERG